MRCQVVVGAVAVVGLALSACGGGDDDGGKQLGTGDTYSVLGALAELPASLDDGQTAGMIKTADLTAATEAAGVERPADTSDLDAIGAWLTPMLGADLDHGGGEMAFVPLPSIISDSLLNVDEFHKELGWSVVDAHWYVDYAGGLSPSPARRLSVFSGVFDNETLSDDLIELDGGVLTDRKGRDGEVDVLHPSAADQTGRPVRLAQDGGLIATSPQTPPVEEWLAGPDETLADDEDLAAVARVLDDADVFSAVLVGVDSSLFGVEGLIRGMAGKGEDPEAVRRKLEAELDGLPPSPFRTVGVGWGADDAGAVITLAYQHADDDAASANAEAFEQLFIEGSTLGTNRPLSELYELVEVETDDTVVAVTVRLGPEGLPGMEMGPVLGTDVPFVHQ